LCVERSVEIANARMIATHDQVRGTHVLPKNGM
jgi:hypothetical protein